MSEAYRFEVSGACDSFLAPIVLCAAVVVLALGAPRRIVIGARLLSFTSALFAFWALAVLPGRFFSVRENIHRRHPFYEDIAIVMQLAVFGALALLTIQKTVNKGAPSAGWREWIGSRAQGLTAGLVACAQVFFVERAQCGAVSFHPETYAMALLGVVAVDAAVRAFFARRPGLTLPTDSPAE